MIRKDGSVSTVSISLPTTADPGNGTKASTTARKVPSTRQPSVEQAAMDTVRQSASRNCGDPTTEVHTDRPRPVDVTVDSVSTRRIG